MSKGYLVQCDLTYPTSLHDYHNDFPLAPFRGSVTDDMLSPLQLQYKQERLRYKSSYKAEDKLLLTLQNRYNYPV